MGPSFVPRMGRVGDHHLYLGLGEWDPSVVPRMGRVWDHHLYR